MRISKIRYKGYEWELNPETLTVVNERNYNEVIMPEGTSLSSTRSKKCRVITGEGMIIGYECLKLFNEILRLQSESESGLLTLPSTKPFYAYFTKLELLCEPTDDAVSYRFQFVEDAERSYIIKEKRYHNVSGSETLWDIAYAYNTEIEKLVQLNPDIKRVDELTAGSGVRIC